MNIDERIVIYVNEILQATDKEKATKKIIDEVNRIYYTESGKYLSNSEKKNIIDRICELLTDEKHTGKKLVLCEKENLNYLAMLTAVSAELAKSSSGGK